MDESLLLAENVRSDDALASAHMVFVETLAPIRTYKLAIQPADSVAKLRAAFMQEHSGALGAKEMALHETQWKLVFNGQHLQDPRAIAASCSMTNGARIVAVPCRSRRGFPGLLVRWGPLLGSAILMVVILVVGFSDDTSPGSMPANQCDRQDWLLRFVFLAGGAPLLLPYGLVLSGALQEETGFRLLWFWHEKAATPLVAGTAAATLIWVAIGAVWLFTGDDDKSSGTLPTEPLPSQTSCGGPQLMAAATFLWVVLFTCSVPLLLIVVTPCLAACRLPVAFSLIGFMAGQHRAPREV